MRRIIVNNHILNRLYDEIANAIIRKCADSNEENKAFIVLGNIINIAHINNCNNNNIIETKLITNFINKTCNWDIYITCTGNKYMRIVTNDCKTYIVESTIFQY